MLGGGSSSGSEKPIVSLVAAGKRGGTRSKGKGNLGGVSRSATQESSLFHEMRWKGYSEWNHQDEDERIE